MSYNEIFNETQPPLTRSVSFPDISDPDTSILPEVNKGPINTRMDIRTALMHEIFDKYPSGALMIYKSFRVGVTTSSCIASIDRHEQLLIVEVTNNIGDSTIVEDIQKERPCAKIVSVKANKFCTKNIELSDQYPDLKKLKLMTLPQSCGEECDDYDKCDVMKILRSEDVDVIVITVDKLVALMLSSGIINKNKKEKDEDKELPITSKILNKLFSVKTVIFDEAHWMQNPVPLSIAIAAKKNEEFKSIDRYEKYLRVLDDFSISAKSLEKPGQRDEFFVDYSPISNEYLPNEMMARVVLNFAALLTNEEIEKVRDAIITEASGPGYHEKHFAKTRKNPQYNWRIKRDMASSISRICIEATKMIVEGKHNSKYRLSVNDINDLFDMASILTAEFIQINAVRSNNNIDIKMSAANRIKFGMIAYFIRIFKELGDKRIILTTATFGSFNYDSILPKGETFEKIIFGENGDPLNTNDKMLILADTKRLSFTKGGYSALQQMPEITKNIIDILNEFGDCFIIAPNKMLADIYKKSLDKEGYSVDVTYYNSDKTIGVKSHSRVAAVICSAEIPTNSYDIITTNQTESMTRRQESVDISVSQAINRVKDPSGLNPSVVFMFGVKEQQANNSVTWGIDRKVNVVESEEPGKRKKIEITCSKYLAKPKVMKCEDFTVSLSVAIRHMGSGESPEVKAFKKQITIGQKPLLPTCEDKKIGILNSISTFKNQSQVPTHTHCNISIGSCDCTRVSHVGLLNLFLKQGLVGASDLLQLNEGKIKRHIDGKHILKTQIVARDGKVCLVLFRDIKFARDVERMVQYLSSVNCPYVIEQDLKLQTYSVWIFIEPIEAKKAKKFGEYIIKGIERISGRNFHCELIPNYTNQKSGKFKENNEIKLPLHPNSKIYINKEFVSTFESLEIGILDISPSLAKIEAYESIAAEGIMVAQGVKNDTDLSKLMEEYPSLFYTSHS